MSKILFVVRVPSYMHLYKKMWNNPQMQKHVNPPLIFGEKVWFLEEVGARYYKVKHGDKFQFTSVFDKSCFISKNNARRESLLALAKIKKTLKKIGLEPNISTSTIRSLFIKVKQKNPDIAPIVNDGLSYLDYYSSINRLFNGNSN